MACLSSTLIYADSGEGKTSLVASWARWVNQVTGKKVRYVTREPGGLDTISDLLDSGILDVWDIGDRPFPGETLEFATTGYWPLPNGKLAAPSDQTWSDIGGYAFEGGTSFGEHLMEEVKDKAAKNEIIGAEKAPQQYVSGDTRIAGANQTFYGMVQGRLRRGIGASQRLPAHIMWTCRETKAEDQDMISGYKEIYGPQLIGQALTPHVPAWFGRTIHLDAVKDGSRTAIRAFYKTHFAEGNKIPYVANPRLPVTVVNELPESEIVAQDGLHMVRLMNKVQELKQRARTLLKG